MFDDVVFDYSTSSIILNPTWDADKEKWVGKVVTKTRGLQHIANMYSEKGFANSFEDLYNNIGN